MVQITKDVQVADAETIERLAGPQLAANIEATIREGRYEIVLLVDVVADRLVGGDLIDFETELYTSFVWIDAPDGGIPLIDAVTNWAPWPTDNPED